MERNEVYRNVRSAVAVVPIGSQCEVRVVFMKVKGQAD